MQEVFKDKDGKRGGSITDLIYGLVNLLSLETQAVWYAVQEGFDPIKLWDEK